MSMTRTRWELLLALTTAACASAPDLRLQADPPVNLRGYNTYQWASASPASDTLLSDVARAAVARGFQARGLAGSAHGDLAVAVSLAAQASKRAPDFGGLSLAPGLAPRSSIETYAEGQLAITIYDARRQRLLWRGLAVGAFDPASEADIERMADALLAQASR